MKNILMVLFLLLSFKIQAEEVKLYFSTAGYRYSLFSSSENLILKGDQVDLELKRKKCNKLILLSFNKLLNQKLKMLVIDSQNYNKLVINQKEYQLDKKSDLALYLADIPSILKTLKQKEIFQCNL